jgi:hypothetical protein
MAEKTELSQEQIIAKAQELSKSLNVKVYPFVLKNGDDKVVGYVKEPSRLSKYRYLDKAMTGAMSAAAELLEVCLIKEESDPRIMSEAPENDSFNIGAATFCASLLNVATDSLKKN